MVMMICSVILLIFHLYSSSQCIADTPCDIFDKFSGTSKEPTKQPTPNPTFPPVQGDDPNNRYCGHNWGDVTENCLTATPCPGGVAFAVCPDGMNCIAETPCNDETYLDWLRDKQAKIEAENNAATTPSPTVSVVVSDGGGTQCMDHSDCNVGQFCNRGFCGQCLDNGTGCSVDQLCKFSGCGKSQNSGAAKCFTVTDLHTECQQMLKSDSAFCDTDLMACEIVGGSGSGEQNTSQQQQQQEESTSTATDTENASSGAGTAAMYNNPDANSFFCGYDYYSIKGTCLVSKPCPGGIASDFCEANEGCFSVVECRAEYAAAKTGSPVSNPPPTPVVETNPPSKLPTKEPSSQPVFSSATIDATTTVTTTSSTLLVYDIKQPPQPTQPPSPSPSASPKQNTNTNYCGETWASHKDDCSNALPCPKGDECPDNQTCFLSSPCATENNLANVKVANICGHSWDELLISCTDAYPCERGDECPVFQTCFKNFACDLNVVVAQEDTTDEGDSEQANAGDSLTSVFTQPQGQLQSPISADDGPPITNCEICGNAGEFDYLQKVKYEGKEIPCGELVWELSANNVYEGSNECLMTRAKYFAECCFVPPENACDLCGIGIDIQLSKNVDFGGKVTSCAEVSNKLSSKFDETSQTCTDAQSTLQSECCYERCELCEDLQPDWDATVYYSGKDVKCHQIDIIFMQEAVSSDSSRCDMSKDLYAENCCIQPIEEPCNICQTESNYYSLDVNAIADYNGASSTCLDVYTYLFSLKAKSSTMCKEAQNELLDQCCNTPEGSSGSDGSQETYDRVPTPSSVGKGTNLPTKSFSSNWYAGDLSSGSVHSFGSISLTSVLLLSFTFR